MINIETVVLWFMVTISKLDFIKDIFPWILSIITIYITVLAGNKHPKAWLLGLFNQFLWLVWIIMTSTWGFLPMNIAFFIVYYRNHVKWTRRV